MDRHSWQYTHNIIPLWAFSIVLRLSLSLPLISISHILWQRCAYYTAIQHIYSYAIQQTRVRELAIDLSGWRSLKASSFALYIGYGHTHRHTHVTSTFSNNLDNDKWGLHALNVSQSSPNAVAWTFCLMSLWWRLPLCRLYRSCMYVCTRCDFRLSLLINETIAMRNLRRDLFIINFWWNFVENNGYLRGYLRCFGQYCASGVWNFSVLDENDTVSHSTSSEQIAEPYPSRFGSNFSHVFIGPKWNFLSRSFHEKKY